MKFFKVDTVEEARVKIENYIDKQPLKKEKVFIADSLDRILAEDIYSDIDIPGFNRSTVDGYAVIAKDLFGAGDTIPTFLEITGKVKMGELTSLKVKTGTAVYIPTGAMLPDGADAVVMIEFAENLDADTIAVYKSVAPGEGIMRKGEDIAKGNMILKKGKQIKPQDIGTLAALGIEFINVVKKITVSVFSTGDEIVSPFQEISTGQIRDINSYVVAAMVSQAGGSVVSYKIIPDDYNLLKDEITKAKKISDIVIMSGGSSVGNKDMTSRVIDDVASQGLITHGLHIKPGKPTIIGLDESTIFFGLPGHPGSAAIVFLAVVRPAIEGLLKAECPRVCVQKAVLDANIHSSEGKRTYQLVDIYESGDCLHALPLFGKSGSISLLSQARGLIVIKEDVEGIEKGTLVDVQLF